MALLQIQQRNQTEQYVNRKITFFHSASRKMEEHFKFSKFERRCENLGKQKTKKITALHPVSFYGNVEGGYPNCRRARSGEVVSSGPPVSTLEPTTFLLWGSSNSQMDKTLQNTYSQTWSWQQHAAGCCSVTGSHRWKDGCRKIQWKRFFQSAPDLTFQKLKNMRRKQCLQKALDCCPVVCWCPSQRFRKKNPSFYDPRQLYGVDAVNASPKQRI